jgi:hypothetical protein
MKGGTLFVQPHSDDLAMSSYFLMKSEIFPKPHYLLTAFSKSNWIDPIKRKKYPEERIKSEKEITRLRVNEDKKFCESTSLIPLFSGLEDCLLRNGKVFYDPKKRLEPELVAGVKAVINLSIKRYGMKNVVAPFPSGAVQHYDHRILREAVVLSLLGRSAKFFVDDLPYSRIANPDKQGLRLFARSRIIDIGEKMRAMEIYESQMCESFFKEVRKTARKNGGYERTFALK